MEKPQRAKSLKPWPSFPWQLLMAPALCDLPAKAWTRFDVSSRTKVVGIPQWVRKDNKAHITRSTVLKISSCSIHPSILNPACADVLWILFVVTYTNLNVGTLLPRKQYKTYLFCLGWKTAYCFRNASASATFFRRLVSCSAVLAAFSMAAIASALLFLEISRPEAAERRTWT